MAARKCGTGGSPVADRIKPGFVYVGGIQVTEYPRPAWADWPLDRIAAHGTHPDSPGPPLIMPGWRAAAWAARLRYLAEKCAPLHPETAAHYRTWANRLDSPGDAR